MNNIITRLLLLTSRQQPEIPVAAQARLKMSALKKSGLAVCGLLVLSLVGCFETGVDPYLVDVWYSQELHQDYRFKTDLRGNGHYCKQEFTYTVPMEGVFTMTIHKAGFDPVTQPLCLPVGEYECSYEPVDDRYMMLDCGFGEAQYINSGW